MRHRKRKELRFDRKHRKHINLKWIPEVFGWVFQIVLVCLCAFVFVWYFGHQISNIGESMNPVNRTSGRKCWDQGWRDLYQQQKAEWKVWDYCNCRYRYCQWEDRSRWRWVFCPWRQPGEQWRQSDGWYWKCKAFRDWRESMVYPFPERPFRTAW